MVDIVYIPVTCGGDHWVACAVNFSDRHITVYDLSPSSHSDAAMKGHKRPLCQLLPRLIRHVGIYKARPELGNNLQPFTFEQKTSDVPRQHPGSGDCGVFTCKFIELLGLGCSFDFGSDHGVMLRRKIALDLFVGMLL
ncbi:Ulp1 protease family, C-terminal catalytic domain containing protein [Melia azedarach]|uniref:Ulp1 protease family, C-terminal catalytic domain containing protein n=1 Tax=Melia azedarach TaxID=155640 RepID=A0ACC1YIP2_MELAZ|nr:Ulp1 protease family, C-terminal catalytic domain containing protein [Melia azedarach]